MTWEVVEKHKQNNDLLYFLVFQSRRQIFLLIIIFNYQKMFIILWLKNV